MEATGEARGAHEGVEGKGIAAAAPSEWSGCLASAAALCVGFWRLLVPAPAPMPPQLSTWTEDALFGTKYKPANYEKCCDNTGRVWQTKGAKRMVHRSRTSLETMLAERLRQDVEEAERLRECHRGRGVK